MRKSTPRWSLLLLTFAVGCSRTNPTKETIAAMLREDIGYTRRLLTFEIGSPDASLSEFQAFCERAIEQRSERLIKIRAAASIISNGSHLMEVVDPELEAEDSLVRSKRQLFEEYARVKALREQYDRAGEQAESANRVSDAFARNGKDTAREEESEKFLTDALGSLEMALRKAEIAQDNYERRVVLAKRIQVAAAQVLKVHKK